ncbi:MAG TPA: ABC transporter permease, partial [Vicinamibacteria bacterium]
RPAFLAAAVFTMALGVGASATLFAVVHGVLLRPFPYRAPERLAILWHEFGEGAQNLPAVHPLDVRDYRERSRLFEELTLATGGEDILGGATEPEVVDVGRVTANFFPFLGVEPALGRAFRAEEDVAGGPAVALLSHRLWVRRFGSDDLAVGKKVELGGRLHEVVGVLPADFRLLLPAEAFRLKDAEVFVPAQIDEARLPPRNFTGYTALGRIRPGATMAATQQEMSAIAAQIRREQPVHEASQLRVHVLPFQSDVVKGSRAVLFLLMGAVLLVLTIACANVALLLLTRGHARARELSVRVAVGASGPALARLVLAEALVIAGLGAALGVGLAQCGLALVKRLTTVNVPRLETVAVDGAVLAFAVFASLLSACLCALLPAWQASRAPLAAKLGEGGSSGMSPRHRRLLDGLAASQLALSLVLVVGAGLLVRAFDSLTRSRPGFNPEGALTLRITVPRGVFTDGTGARAFHRALHDRLRALPGMAHVGMTSLLPFTGRGPLQPFAYDEETARNWESLSADDVNVSPGYFAALGATLLAGRDLIPGDADPGRRAIVIDDSLARRAFGGVADAVGRRLQLEPEGAEESFFEVVGVVAHLRLHDVARASLPQIYRPGLWTRLNVVVRGSAPEALADAVRRDLRAFQPGIAVEETRPLSDLVREALGPVRLAMAVMTAFGVIALLLAGVGTFGVFSFTVQQRTREIAVRLALGAAPSGIRALFLGRALRLAGLSLAAGALGAALLSRASAGLLFDVHPLDPWAWTTAAAFLLAVALSAGFIPADRAARTEPLASLKRD